jgi:2-methylcitrate synthase/citrate synthase II
MSNPAYSPGLEGVIAGETTICTVEGGLSYRGYGVGDLAEHCTFEEVAHLLLHGELPSAVQLAAFQSRVAAARRLPPPLKDLLGALPKWTTPLDALRTAVSALGHFDQDAADNSHDANLRKAERLLAQIPVAVADHHRLAKGLQPVLARQDLGQAANFLFMLRDAEPTSEEVKALDVSLILYAEHEFNASTFAGRVIVSTLSDMHSGITGAIGALKGPLHGGANEKVMDILMDAGGPDTAEKWTRDALARKERIMGFGHRVYKSGDVRAGILKVYSRKMAEQIGDTKWEDTADLIERVMAAEKNMYPNLDWPAGRLYHAMKLEIPLYTPIFAMSRISGWAAHVIEQLDNNRLIRPRAQYKGPPPRKVKPIAERG